MAQPAPTREPAAPLAVPPDPFPWYIAGVGSWFGAFGMQGVLFSWLVVGVLGEPAHWVGIAQSASMIPGFALILVGGAVADRRDRRVLLIGLHLAATALVLGLLGIVGAGELSLALLIIYALLMGTIGAFALPARDSLLSEVTAGRDLMRAVTAMTVTQWSMQALGALLAGGARFVGIVPALALQALALFAGVSTLRKLAPAPPHPEVARQKPRLTDVLVGVREVWHSSILFPMLLLVACVGLLFVGPFMVVFPLLLRDFYAGDVGDLGVLSAAFPAGVISGSLVLLWRRGIRRKGRAALLALLSGSVCLGVIALGLPFVGTLVAVYAWGLAASVFMNASRTVFQERAPDRHRARVLSVYTLGFMGAAGLVGAPLSGVLVGVAGPLETCGIMAGLMVLAAVAVHLTTNVATVE